MDNASTRQYKESVYKLPSALEAWREAAKMTQKQLADAINVTQQSVSDWERGVSTPSLKNLAAIGVALKVSPGELGAAVLDGDPEDGPETLERRVRRLEELLAEAPPKPGPPSKPR